MSIYLSMENQDRIFRYFNTMLAVSTTLNINGLVFLVKLTPPNQAVVRTYLILVQILLMLSDIHLEVGFHPIPIFPAPAGYAVGQLIRMGVSVYVEFMITIIFYAWLGMSILICGLVRHQNILMEGHRFKFKKKTVFIIKFLLLATPTVPCVLFAFRGSDEATMEKLLHEDPRNITWIRERGQYYFEQMNPALRSLCVFILCNLIFGFPGLVLLFVHMFHVLRRDSTLRSQQSIYQIRKSLIALFCQVVGPFAFFVIPTVMIFVGLVFENLLSFDISLAMFLLLPMHSLAHNTILLTITSTYRKIIISGVKNIFEISLSTQVKPSAHKISYHRSFRMDTFVGMK